MRGKLTADQARRLAAAVLGIDEHASADVARSAYLRAAATVHPDVGGSVGAFRDLQTAWAVWCELDARTTPAMIEPSVEGPLPHVGSEAASRFTLRTPRLGWSLDVAI